MKWRTSLYLRLALIFVLVMSPIYIIGISIYDWGVRTVRMQLESAMADQAAAYLNSLEAEIQRIRLLQYDARAIAYGIDPSGFSILPHPYHFAPITTCRAYLKSHAQRSRLDVMLPWTVVSCFSI
jgi:hypothetical protein